MTIRSNQCFKKELECKETIQTNCFYGCIYTSKSTGKKITLLTADSLPWLEKEM